MPKMDGLATLKELKSLNIQTPIIFITSMSDIDHIKEAFNIGANDYLKKPFHLDELEIRILKLTNSTNSTIVKLSNLYSFDLSLMELREGEKVVSLSENETQLMYKLVKNIGHIVRSETLIEYVWSQKDVTTNTLRTQIKKIRDKLKEDFIKNIRGIGYKIDKYNE
jgi:DNA-binding response OmpR family regulator